jgi:hypothetical protein
LAGAELVEQADRMLASVSSEVAVVAIDHGQPAAHVAGEVEGGDAGTERKGGECVSEIVDPAQGLDPGRQLRGLPLAVAEVVQVEVATRSARSTREACPLDRWRSIASSAIVCSGTARRLASVFGHFSRPFVNERWT